MFKQYFCKNSSTLPTEPVSLGGAFFIGTILGFGTFWNGALIISALLILAVCFLLFKTRLHLFIVGVTATGIAVLQSNFFIHQGPPFFPRINIGFLAESSDLLDIGLYYFKLFGPLIPLLMFLFLKMNNKGKLFLAGALTPIVFATTFMFTDPIEINHKFINAGWDWLAIFAAVAIAIIWRSSKHARIPAAILAIMMTLTGWVDLVSLWNKNSYKISHRMHDPLANWAMDHLDKKAVLAFFPAYHQILYLTGRPAYLGHAGWVHSAGYDFGKRFNILREIYEGGNPDTIRQIMQTERIDYLLVDRVVEENFKNLNEANIQQALHLVYNSQGSRLYSFR